MPLNKPPFHVPLDNFYWKQWFEDLRNYVENIVAGGGGVTSVSASAPLASSGGTTPTISISSTIAANLGGTGIASYTVGDIIYASGATTLSKLADVATGNVLISGGIATAPAWGKVGLTTHISGTLAIGNGGTGSTTILSGVVISNGSALSGSGWGSAGTVLYSTGTTVTWQFPSNSRYVFNGDFRIWQMGTGGALTAISGQTSADLWSYYSGANFAQYTITQQAGTDMFQYQLRYRRVTGNTDTNAQYLFHDLTTEDSYQFQGKTIAVSFYARCGAGYSATGTVLTAHIETGTGTDQARRSGAYTGSSDTAENKTLTTSWQRFTITKTIDATATQLGIWFTWTPVGVALAGDWFDITGVQIDYGSYALPWREHNYNETLEACQRRLFKTFPMATAPAQNTGSVDGAYQMIAHSAGAVTQRGLNYPLPTRMRTAPTITGYNMSAANAQIRDTTAGADCSATAWGSSQVSFWASCTGNAATAVGYRLAAHVLADARL